MVMTTMHARSLLAGASRFAERLGMPLALIHAVSGETESQGHLREAANQLAIPVEKHIIWNQSESVQDLWSSAEQADMGLFAYPREKVQSRIWSRLENDPLPFLSV